MPPGGPSRFGDNRRLVLRWLVTANVIVSGLIAVLLVVTLSASRAAHRQRAFDAVESLARSLEINVAATVLRLVGGVGHHGRRHLGIELARVAVQRGD